MTNPIKNFSSSSSLTPPSNNSASTSSSSLTVPQSLFVQAQESMNANTTTTALIPAPMQKSTIPPDILKSLVRKNAEKLLANAAIYLGEGTKLPSLSALSILSVKDVCSYIQMELVMKLLTRLEEHLTPTQAQFDTLQLDVLQQMKSVMAGYIVSTGKALGEEDPKYLENLFAIFDVLDSSTVMNSTKNTMLNIIKYLKTKHADDISKRLGEFYSEGELIPSVTEVRALASRLLVIQDYLITRLNPLLREIEKDIHSNAAPLVVHLQRNTAVSPGLDKPTNEVVAQSLKVSQDILRLVKQFCLFASLRREKVKNIVLQVGESLSEGSLTSSLLNQIKFFETLSGTKNPFIENAIDYLNLLENHFCLSAGLYYERKEVDLAIYDLLLSRVALRCGYLKTITSLIKNEKITLGQFCDMEQEIAEGLGSSFGESSKSTKGKRNVHTKREEIKEEMKTHIGAVVKLIEVIVCGESENMRELLRMNKTTRINVPQEISELHNVVMHAVKTKGIESPRNLNAYQGLMYGVLAFEDSIKHFDADFHELKSSFLENNRQNQEQIHGGMTNAKLVNSTIIEAIQATKDLINNYKQCDNLLLHLSQITGSCHAFLSQHTPPTPNLEDYEWFHELEKPRVIKKKEVTNESPTSTAQKGSSSSATSATKAIEKPTEETAIQAQLKVLTPDTALLEMFVKAKEIMLGNKGPDMKKMDPDLLYQADAAYHLFHAITIVDMIGSGSAEQLRFYIPELINAVAHMQEQIITPIYVREKNPNTVIHDLNKMSSDLNITKNFSFNFGSQSYRYPHSMAETHARHNRESPKWLQEMLALDDQAEITFEDHLRMSLERVQIGLEFATELLGSDALKSVACMVKERLKKVRSSNKTGVATPSKDVGNLMVLLEQVEEKIKAKNNPRVTTLWRDLKVHARRFKRAEELFRTYPEQKLLSVHARAIIMSAQYFAEHAGHILILLSTDDDLQTHSLADFAVLDNWEAKIDQKWMKFLDELDIKKGADYPHWSIYNGNEAKALDIINGAFEVATIAAESDEGFQGSNKESRKPDEVRKDLRTFADNSLGLMNALAKLLNDSL